MSRSSLTTAVHSSLYSTKVIRVVECLFVFGMLPYLLRRYGNGIPCTGKAGRFLVCGRKCILPLTHKNYRFAFTPNVGFTVPFCQCKPRFVKGVMEESEGQVSSRDVYKLNTGGRRERQHSHLLQRTVRATLAFLCWDGAATTQESALPSRAKPR